MVSFCATLNYYKMNIKIQFCGCWASYFDNDKKECENELKEEKGKSVEEWI